LPEPQTDSTLRVRELRTAEVHFVLGRLLARGARGGLKLAERHLRSALEADPGDAAVLEAMAELKDRQGETTGAEAYRRGSAGLATEDE
jgi:hypothetical protein